MNPGELPSRRRRLWTAAVALLLFTIIGFFVLPPIVKGQLEKRLTVALGRTVTVGKVRINPYALSVTFENFDIRLKEGTGSFMGWNRLYVNFDALASLTGDWVLGEIELEGYHVAVIIKPDGSLNFSDILARLAAPGPPPAAPAKPARPIRIGSLKVAQARVEFTDQSRPKAFTTILGPVSFGATELRTVGARGAPYHFEAVTEAGEKFTWSGTLSAVPFRSAGELRLENVVLAKYAPYYADRVQADLVEGKLSVRGRYEIDLRDDARVLKLADGSGQLRGLKVLERANQEAAVELPALDITGVNADALAPKVSVGSVSLAGGHLHVRRGQDGTINLLRMFLPPVDPAVVPASGAAAVAPAKPLEISLREFSLKDFQVEFSDLAAPRPAHLELGGIQLSLKNVTLADGAVLPLQLALNWAPHGTVKLEGSVSLKPELKADLKLEVAALEILPLSPYLEQFINARITQGAVATTGLVKVGMAGGTPAITFDGGGTVENFGLVDGAHSEELAGFATLALSGLRAETAPQLMVAVAEVNVTAPYARVLVNQDKSLNLAAVAKTDPAPPPAAVPAPGTPATTAAPLPKIEIGKVVISGGDFSLADRSLEPNVRMAVNQFGGTIAGLSSENLARADVDLRATVDGAGPITITGKLDPLGANKFVDLKINFKSVDLLPLSPYSGKYAGYELARGKLTLDVKFLLDGKKIDAANVVTLNQFTFGAAVPGPDATGLPVRLGVALLKDVDGQIVIDLPVSGSLDDPSFGIGRVVMRVVVNLLTKAAVSPFALLGSMFGGGGDELAFQEFTPGSASLLPAEEPKLATMVKALTNRPGLSVALEGGYDGPADTYALRQQKLTAFVRSRIWEERHAVDPNIAPPEKLEIAPDAYAAMVKRLFDEKFPPGTEFGAPLAKAPVAAAPPPAPKKGVFGRVVDVVTLKGLRSGAATPAEAAKPKTAGPAEAGAPAGPSLEEMSGRLAETMAVTDNDLRALAADRAQRVRDYLANTGGIAADRLFLTQGQDATKQNKGPRVLLSLQ